MLKLLTGVFLFFVISASADVGLVPADSFEILKSYRFQEQTLSDPFIKDFPLLVHQDIIDRRNAFFASGKCADLQVVTFAPQVKKPVDAVEKEFFAGVVRIEASRCYDSGEPEELIAITKNPNFKKRAFSTLSKIESTANNDCEWTEAPMVGKSNYCYSNIQEIENGVPSAFTFLISNNVESQFDAPVFLRQTLTAAKKIGHKTVVYVVSYVRSNPMGSTKQFFAKGVIEKMQSKVFDEIAKAHQNKGN